MRLYLFKSCHVKHTSIVLRFNQNIAPLFYASFGAPREAPCRTIPVLLGLEQLPVAADLQLQGQLGVLEDLEFPDDLLQAVLQAGDPLGVLVVLTVVLSLHVGHLAFQGDDLVAQFGVLHEQYKAFFRYISYFVY